MARGAVHDEAPCEGARLLAETTREERARQAFAQMYDADGKDIDERTEMPADAMDDFMKSLRKEAGLEHPEEEEDVVGDA